MRVVANGIASQAETVNIQAWGSQIIFNTNTFSQDEVQSLLGNANGGPATISPVLYVAVDGFKPSELQLNLGNLSSPPLKPKFQNPIINGVTLDFTDSVLPDDTALPDNPQHSHIQSHLLIHQYSTGQALTANFWYL